MEECGKKRKRKKSRSLKKLGVVVGPCKQCKRQDLLLELFNVHDLSLASNTRSWLTEDESMGRQVAQDLRCMPRCSSRTPVLLVALGASESLPS